jgi:hypothetical protein
MKLDEQTIARVVGCRSDFEIGSFLGDIQVDGLKGLTTLRSDPGDLDAKAKRYELIESVRGGKHIELAVTAVTFRQQKGKQNRRYLRLGGDLSAQVATFAKQPFLLDHNTMEQSSRKGTILTSKLVSETSSRDAFEMTFNAVKPDAVVSVLDGTLDRFSIGWFPLGPVLCTVHGADIRLSDSCSCWPGDVVLVDGKAKIAEYEFTVWSGKELSGVNIPAVQHTNIEGVRAALAAELNISPTRTHNRNKENRMRLHRLAAALGVTALEDTDETSAVLAVEALQRRATTAEAKLATTQTQLSNAEAALGTATAAAKKVQIDTILARDGYGAGKLRHAKDADGQQLASPREARLRRIAAEPNGIEALKLELAEMEAVVPVGQRPQSEAAGSPPKTDHTVLTDEPIASDNPYIANVAQQLGLKPEDMVAFANGHVAGGR